MALFRPSTEAYDLFNRCLGVVRIFERAFDDRFVARLGTCCTLKFIQVAAAQGLCKIMFHHQQFIYADTAVISGLVALVAANTTVKHMIVKFIADLVMQPRLFIGIKLGSSAAALADTAYQALCEYRLYRSSNEVAFKSHINEAHCAAYGIIGMQRR